MKHSMNLAMIPPLALIIAAPLFAQETGTEQEKAPSPELATRAMAPTFVKLAAGKSALVINENGERLGTMREHVIDRKSGVIDYIVVDVPPGANPLHSKLVPFDLFEWNTKEKRFKLPMSREALDALPEFEPLKLQQLGKTAKAEAEAKTEKPTIEAGDDTGPAVQRVRYLLSSSVFLGRVQAEGKIFSTVTELLMEPTKGQVTFVLAQGVKADADPYVIPWLAMSWSADAEGKSQFEVPVKAEELVKAPKLEGGEMKALERKELTTRIRRFYKLGATTEVDTEATPRG